MVVSTFGSMFSISPRLPLLLGLPVTIAFVYNFVVTTNRYTVLEKLCKSLSRNLRESTLCISVLDMSGAFQRNRDLIAAKHSFISSDSVYRHTSVWLQTVHVIKRVTLAKTDFLHFYESLTWWLCYGVCKLLSNKMALYFL